MKIPSGIGVRGEGGVADEGNLVGAPKVHSFLCAKCDSQNKILAQRVLTFH